MESSSICLGDIEAEEFIVDNKNKNVKGAWIIPIIQKDMIYKNPSFN